MIPDKIYIGRVTLSSNEPGEQHLLPGWHKRPNPKITNTEYIRKDALLEWAKELRENARASRENPPSIEFDRYMEGKEKTISKFIDKLNSL